MPVKLYQRSKLKQTASALNGSPSWNVTVAKIERPLQAVGTGLPRLRQRRHDLGAALLGLDQALEDLVDHTRGLAVADQRSVDDDRILGRAEDHAPAGRFLASPPPSSDSPPPHAAREAARAPPNASASSRRRELLLFSMSHLCTTCPGCRRLE